MRRDAPELRANRLDIQGESVSGCSPTLPETMSQTARRCHGNLRAALESFVPTWSSSGFRISKLTAKPEVVASCVPGSHGAAA